MTQTTIDVNCIKCKTPHQIPATVADMMRIASGELIQNVLTELTPHQREMLISGICESCWNDMFGEEDDEDTTLLIREVEHLPNSTQCACEACLTKHYTLYKAPHHESCTCEECIQRVIDETL